MVKHSLGDIWTFRQLLACWLMLICSFAGNSLAALAQAESDFELLRVYIPENKQAELIPSDYKPINEAELIEKLRLVEQRRQAAEFDEPTLSEAFYVARFQGSVLESKNSRWRVVGLPGTQSVPLGRTSLTIQEPADQASDLSLLSNCHFTVDGLINVNHVTREQDFWFGFKKKVDQATGKIQVDVPPANIARLLIAAPLNVSLSSDTAPVVKIESQESLLPEDWPSDSIASMKASATTVQWWSVNLSGLSSCSLSVAMESEGSKWQSLIASSAEYDFTVRPNSVDIVADFSLVQRVSRKNMRLKVSRDVRLRSALLDDKPTTWRTIPNLSKQHHLIEFPATDASAIKINATVDRSSNSEQAALNRSRLPELTLAESLVLSGSTTVRCADSLLLLSVQRSGAIADSSNDGLQVDPNSKVDALIWKDTWIDQPPLLTIESERRVANWELEGLTKVNLQPGSLSAVANLTITSPSTLSGLDSNELRIPIGGNWLLDDVRLVGQAPSDLQISRFETAVEAVSRGVSGRFVVISWSELRDSLSFQLEAKAHQPLVVERDSQALDTSVLLSLPEGKSEMNYAVSIGDGLRLVPSTALLSAQTEMKQLPSWQQTLLDDEVEELLLFEGVGGENQAVFLPELTVASIQGTLTASLATIVKAETTEYHIMCQPDSGPIGEVPIVLPITDDRLSTDLPVFSLLDEVTRIPTQLSTTSRRLSGSQREVILQLPQRLSRPFEIRSTQPREDGSKLRSIELWAIPKASAAQSTLIIPRNLAAISGQPMLELLPTRSCCSSEELAKLRLDFKEEDLSRLLAARVDASVATEIELYPTVETSQKGWVWEELVLHQIGSNNDTHNVQWDIERNDLKEIAAFVPDGWTVNRVQIEERDIDFESIDSPRGLLIPLPETSRVRVVAEFVSESSTGWISKHIVEIPRLELPVHERTERFVLPPNRVEFEGSGSQQSNALLLSRLIPSRWWSWLSPAQEASSQPSPEINRLHGEVFEIWTIEKTAISTMLVSLLLGTAAICFWICRSVYIWIGFAGALLSLLILAPLQYAPYLQTLLLGFALSAMCRLICYISLLPSLGRKQDMSASSGSVRKNGSTIPAACIALLALFSNQTTAVAQTESETRPAATKSKKIYGVITPVDETQSMSGQTVYISPALERLLSGTTRSNDLALEPKILAADYTVRITQSDSGDEFPKVNLDVDFELQVEQADEVIEVPFDRDELLLESIRVQGQERLLNSQSQSSSSVRFETPSTGNIQIQLGFQAVAVDRSGAGTLKLSAAIPSIPNATLRIISDDRNKEFEVVSAGDIQRFVNGELFTNIGPVGSLDVSWVESNSETLKSRPISVRVDTWVHAAGDEPLAICQMQIDPATVISTSEIERETGRRSIRVTTNDEWDVVGVFWGDAFQENPSSYVFGSRRVYTLELRDPQEIRNRAMDPTNAQPVTIRVVMVPNSISDETNAIGVPFLRIAQQPTRRLLGWSTDEDSDWRFDDLEFEKEVPATMLDWGGLKLGAIQWSLAKVKLFEVPILGSGALQIRRSTMPAVEAADELTIQEQTKLHVGVFKSRYEYAGTYVVPNRPLGASGNRDLQFELPLDAVVSKVEINGGNADYVRLSGEASNRYVLFSGRSSGPKNLLIEFTRPTQFDSQMPLSKPSFSELRVSSSEYEVFASSGVNCQIMGPQIPIESEEIVTDVDQLESLERPVIAIELLPEQRDEMNIATEMVVSRAPEFSPTQTLLAINREGEEWFATFSVEYSNDESQSEFAYIEIPYSIRDIITLGETPRVFLPALDSNRVILCALPKRQPKNEAGDSELSFTFRLESAGSAQTLRIPQIRVLGSDPVMPRIAAPISIDEQTVQWSGNVRKSDQLIPSNTIGASEYVTFVASGQDSQLTYQFIEESRRSARVARKSLWLKQWSEEGAAAIASYWLEPQGQLSQEFRLPEDATISGVQVEGSPAVWRKEGSSVFVTLQPNYLAVEVRLIVQLGPSLVPPVVIADSQPLYTTLFLSPQENRVMRVLEADSTLFDRESVLTDIQQWVDVVVNTLRPDSRTAKDELALWAGNWTPQAKGINVTERIEDSELIDIPWVEAPSQVDLNQDGQVQALELWKDLVSEAGLDGMVEVGNPSLSNELSQAIRQTMPDGSTMKVIVLGNATPTDARLIAACLIALASTLFLILTYRLRRAIHETLSRHVWGYWAILAFSMWLFLPIAWPAYFMFTVAAGVMVTRSIAKR